jgi:flagellar biogenesis protein FliO
VLSLLQVLFALLIVLAAIGLFAWLMRRFGPGQAAPADCSGWWAG